MDAMTLLFEAASGAVQVSRRPMKNTIAEKLATLIASGAISVGDELPSERDLASAMRVSRETIRGALLILSTRGILSVVQGARTMVISANVGELALAEMPYRDVKAYSLEDVHGTRLVVEEALARRAAELIDAASLKRLQDLIAAQEAAKEDPLSFLISDREFHTVIYSAGANRVLADVATTLYAYLMDHRRRVVARPGAIDVSISDHRAIFDALVLRDGNAAAAAFKVHERRIYETTHQIMSREGLVGQSINRGGRNL